MSDERHRQGLEIRRQVLGDEPIERSLAVEPEFMAPFQELANENYAASPGGNSI